MPNKAVDNIEWDADPNPPGSSANRRHSSGTRSINANDRRFYAIYCALDHSRSGLPDKVVDIIASGEYASFVDKANPFYRHDSSMYGIPEDQVESLVSKLRDASYIVEVRHDTSQFCFTPKPTVGEIVIKGVKKDAI